MYAIHVIDGSRSRTMKYCCSTTTITTIHFCGKQQQQQELPLFRLSLPFEAVFECLICQIFGVVECQIHGEMCAILLHLNDSSYSVVRILVAVEPRLEYDVY